MLKDPQIFLYISLVRYKAIPKLLDKIKKKEISIILDFEDSSKDIFSPKNTEELKSKCRVGFKYLSSLKKNYKNIFIRINAEKSRFYLKDVACLEKTLSYKSIKGIFVPKTEKYETLLKINKKLQLNKKKIKLIPIIESKKGYKNLNNILSKDNDDKLIYGIHYGHFDYCLNNKLWPYPEPYHKEFWNIIFPIIKCCIKYNKKFIHTPFPLVNSPELFYKSINYINKNFKNIKLALSLVNFDERFLKRKFKKNNKLHTKNMSKDSSYKIKFAKKIINNYIATKKSKKSFSLSSKRFIPPHQFVSAKFYLSRYGK